MLLAARTEARSKFEQSRTISSASEDAVKAIEHAEGVAQILRQNIVQGAQEEGPDRFSTLHPTRHTPRSHADALAELNIHDEIERGDNESINNPPKNKIRPGMKCS